jgi:hypothetical protein
MFKYFEITHANDNGKSTFALTDEGEELFEKIINQWFVTKLILILLFVPCLILFIFKGILNETNIYCKRLSGIWKR